MPHSTWRSVTKLPQVPETWLIGIAPLRIWITPPNELPHHPWLIIVVSEESGMIRASNLVPDEPTPAQVRDVLFNAMRKPERAAGKPARPQAIALAPSKIVKGLLALLAEADLEIDAYETELPPEFKDLVAELEEHLRGGPEHPGYLSVAGVTPELVGAFFQAAAGFYRAAPWVQLNNYQVLALRHPAEQDYRYAIVMGQGGVEYGLAVYSRWADVERQFLNDENPLETIPKRGLHSFFYDTIDKVPFDDLEAIEKFGWELAAPKAYPIAIIVEAKGEPRRPSRGDLLWYEAALRSIPLVVRDYLKPNGRGDYEPVESTVEVATHSGTIPVAIKYPAGEIPLAEQPAQEPQWEEGEGEDEEVPHLDRRAMEGAMFQLTQQFGGETTGGDPDLDAAQELMYRAWEETNPAKRIALAHDALARSADCADAYVLLAEEEADTVSRALDYYQKGVEAGERALGKEYLKENVGHFWGLLETRPYMRAREGLANALWRLNRKDEALAEYRELLRLNPNDNQGVRYLALDLLLQMERYGEAEALLAQYPDEWSAVWKYTQALLAYRAGGAAAHANKALDEALEQNPHVPPYLTGEKRVPNRRPDYMGMGDEREAIWYAGEHLNYWRRVPGAVEWLKAHPVSTRGRPKTRSKMARGSGKGRKRKPGR
jgi:tetratricopeptide (TPR) repeat protein